MWKSSGTDQDGPGLPKTTVLKCRGKWRRFWSQFCKVSDWVSLFPHINDGCFFINCLAYYLAQKDTYKSVSFGLDDRSHCCWCSHWQKKWCDTSKRKIPLWPGGSFWCEKFFRSTTDKLSHYYEPYKLFTWRPYHKFASKIVVFFWGLPLTCRICFLFELPHAMFFSCHCFVIILMNNSETFQFK